MNKKEFTKSIVKVRTIDGQEVKMIDKTISISGFKVLDEEGTFEAYASIFGNVDSYGEVVDKGAFKEWLDLYFNNGKKRFPKCVWAHDWSQPIAQTLECREDERGLYLKGKFVLEVQKAAEVYALMKAGVITDFSFGFSVQEDSWDEATGHLHLKKIAIYEWSPVLVGANREATLLGVKADGEEATPAAPAEEATPTADAPAATDENPEKPTEATPAEAETTEKPGEDGKPSPEAVPAETDEAKNARLAERKDALDTAIEAAKSLSIALEALKATEDGSSAKETDTSEVEKRDGKGDTGTARVVKAILRDARKADKIVESIILRAKKI